MHLLPTRPASRLATVVLAIALTACGGSPSPSEPPAPPPAPPTAPGPMAFAPTVAYGAKRFDLSWLAAPEATYYQVGVSTSTTARTVLADNLTGLHHAVADLDLVDHDLTTNYAVRACNTAGCGGWSPTRLPDANHAIGYVKSMVPGNVGFGRINKLAPDGRTLAVQAGPYNLQLFTRDVTGWRHLQTLSRPEMRGAGSIAFSGEGTLLWGGYHSGSIAGVEDPGEVFAYRFDGTAWVQEQVIDNPAPAGSHNLAFGGDVDLSLDGRIALVSAMGTSLFGGFTGKVYVYRRDDTTGWGLVATLAPAFEHTGALFGAWLAISADASTIAATTVYHPSGSALDESDTSSSSSGAAHVFRRVGSTDNWVQTAYLKEPVIAANANFGSALALSGDGTTLAIGARNSRVVYVYQGANGVYGAPQTLEHPPSAARFGYDLAMTNDASRLVLADMTSGDLSAGLGHTPVAAGATSVGAAYVFTPQGGSYQFSRYLKAPNPRVSSYFGQYISVAGDEGSVAIGSPSESSGATGVGGDWSDTSGTNSGALYLY